MVVVVVGRVCVFQVNVFEAIVFFSCNNKDSEMCLVVKGFLE